MRRTVIGSAVVTIVLVAAGVVAWRVATQKSTYEQALSWLPSSTLRASYTDWAQVRASAKGATLGRTATPKDVSDFLERAYEQDLVFTSAVSDSTYVLLRRFGFSPLDAVWESYGQSREGAVDVLALDDSVDMGAIEQNLRTLGYTPPARRSGVWAGGVDLVTGIDPSLSAVQQNVVVLADRHVVLMSDSARYAATAAAVVDGSAPDLATVPGVADLGGIPADPTNATLWSRDFACEDLSMGTADQGDQQVGRDLVDRAGGIDPLSGLVMAREPSREIVVGLGFETSDQASANLQPRVDLASGDAPGQGGSFADRFRVTSGKADGSHVVLRLRQRGDAVLSDISQGPVLFATC